MESIITAITSNKIILTIAVILSVLILFSVIKKLLKIAVVLIAILVIYIGYMVYTGQKVPKTKQEIIQHSTKKLDEFKKAGSKTLK